MKSYRMTDLMSNIAFTNLIKEVIQFNCVRRTNHKLSCIHTVHSQNIAPCVSHYAVVATSPPSQLVLGQCVNQYTPSSTCIAPPGTNYWTTSSLTCNIQTKAHTLPQYKYNINTCFVATTKTGTFSPANCSGSKSPSLVLENTKVT